MPTRIVKVGGSLLDWPDLPKVLRSWLADQSPALNVLLCGGGVLADTIRRADRDFSLGEETSHWLCIDALSVSARLLAAILRDAPLVARHEELAACAKRGEARTIVVDPCEFLRHHEADMPGRRLPHDWSVTSDSIAARLAEIVQADELVLLKSRDPPAESFSELAVAGFVDRNFPVAAAAVRKVQVVNLRLG